MVLEGPASSCSHMSYTGTSGPLYTGSAHFQVGRAAETTRGHAVLTRDRGSVVAWAAFEREKFRAQVIRRPGASHCNCQRATGGQFGCRRGYDSFNQATGQIGAGTGETAEGHGGDLFPQVRRVRTRSSLAAPSPLKCPLVARQCGHHHCAGYFGA
jgi:hypothetical protein